jgi:hypothetical protein
MTVVTETSKRQTLEAPPNRWTGDQILQGPVVTTGRSTVCVKILMKDNADLTLRTVSWMTETVLLPLPGSTLGPTTAITSLV